MSITERDIMSKLYVIDFMNLFFRNYHAFEKMNMTTSDGIPTGALFGMATSLVSLIKKENPDYIAVAMESDQSIRKNIYPRYKENREGMPSDVERCLPHVVDLFRQLKIPMFKMTGYEADDVIGCIVKTFRDRVTHTYIVSGDKDFMQLIRNNVSLYIPKTKGEYVVANGNQCFQKFGCMPDQVVDVLALMGDKIDCIPGVQGIGPKGAAKLINQFGTVENMYSNEEELRKSVTAKQFKKLIAGKEDAMISKKLAKIVDRIVIPNDFNDLKFNPDSLKSDNFLEFLDRYELKSVKNKIFVDLNGLD